MSRQPEWDLDFRTGQDAERLAYALLTDATVQVKHDRIAMRTGRLYVETECFRQGRWMPSGVFDPECEATVWFFVLDADAKLSVSMSKDRLLEHVERFRTNVLEERDGSHPTRGVGVPLAAVTRELVGGSRWGS